jgi:2-polyprenyl-3-methyl-5-hydroxy-6-metoxy-1,4-benzoquinol methylase
MSVPQAELADGAAVQAAYDQWHSHHEVDATASAPWYTMIKSRLQPERDLAGRRVLEIGCGLGGFAVWLSRHPATPAAVTAADYSPVAIDKARRYAHSQGTTRIDWRVADIQRLDEFGEEFDTVLSCETIEHVPDPPRAIRELARVLRPGGRLYLTTPNYLGIMGLHRAYCRVRGKPCDEGGQPICQLTLLPRTRAWVRAAGLHIVVMDSCGHYLPFPGRAPIDLRMVARPHFLFRWFGLHSLVVAEKAAR